MSDRRHNQPPDRRTGAWMGLAVGDALGAPVEFLSAAEIGARHGRVTEMMAGGPWQAGEWTDDTELTLATAQAYAGGTFDPAAAAAAMVAWADAGPKDIGNLTAETLRLIAGGRATFADAGARALEAHPNAAGNGSLMRAMATGIVRAPDDPRLLEESRILSAITHADERCVAACVAFNYLLATLVHGDGDVGRALQETASHACGWQGDVDDIVAGVVAGRAPTYANSDGIGYVLVCFERALIALRDAPSFEDGVIDVVNMGGDSDTNAAVAGALLGARFGFDAIPARWLRALRRTGELTDCLATLAPA